MILFRYYFTFYSLTTLLVIASAYFGRVEEFRTLNCLMLAISISFLPTDIAFGLTFSQATVRTALQAQQSAGGATRSAGLIIFVLCAFASMCILATPNLEFAIQFRQITKTKQPTSKIVVSVPGPAPSPIPASGSPAENSASEGKHENGTEQV
jgi:hypothetical protein